MSMGGFVLFLGFALPFALAFDRTGEGPRDAYPSRGLCSLCKRWKEETYRLTSLERICVDDMTAVVHRSGARRIRPQPRAAIPEWPLEKVAEKSHQLTPLDTWWDRQFV